jgi:hypothetical protein
MLTKELESIHEMFDKKLDLYSELYKSQQTVSSNYDTKNEEKRAPEEPKVEPKPTVTPEMTTLESKQLKKAFYEMKYRKMLEEQTLRENRLNANWNK